MQQQRVEKQFAEFYDLWVADFELDIPIYLDLCAKHAGPVMEAGCRTGRVTYSLARAGYEVVGIDVSASFLQVARRRLEPHSDRVRLTRHDMRTEPLFERFGVAIVSLFSLNQLIDVEELRLFLRHLHRSMAGGAAVAIDCFCPRSLAYPDDDAGPRTVERLSDGHRIVVVDSREMLTPLLERRVQRFRIDDGPETEVVTHRRFLPPAQVERLLEEAGFEGIVQIRGYDPTSLGPVEPGVRADGPFLMLAER